MVVSDIHTGKLVAMPSVPFTTPNWSQASSMIRKVMHVHVWAEFRILRQREFFFLTFTFWWSCFVVEKKGCYNFLSYSFADKWIPYKIITSHHFWFGSWITVFGEQYKQRNCSLCRFILSVYRPPAWHYRLNTLFSSSLIFCLPVWQTDKTVVQYRCVLFLVFWGT